MVMENKCRILVLAALVLLVLGLSTASVLANPDILEAFESLFRTARESLEYFEQVSEFDNGMKKAGYPAGFSAVTYAPFDVIGDIYRGMRGVMLDMRRQADKLHDAMEKITPVVIQAAVLGAKKSGIKRIFVPLHWGADGFMSDEQYRTFENRTRATV